MESLPCDFVGHEVEHVFDHLLELSRLMRLGENNLPTVCFLP